MRRALLRIMKTIIPYKVEVVPYDIHWLYLFQDEANRIQKILGAYLKEIYHIGSTSIPNVVKRLNTPS